MLYLERFVFPGGSREELFLGREKHTCYDSFYPFQVFPRMEFECIDFEPVTILCGGNGCGKTTALNVIAEKLGMIRESAYNRSNFFRTFIDMCTYEANGAIPADSRIITSDDVFDYMLDLRAVNEGIDRRRDELMSEYLDVKYSDFRMASLDDYEQLKKVNFARGKSQSKYVRANVKDNIRERSNGESAFMYFAEKIRENALYLLDEPENSLSAERQIELVKFLEDSARYFGCQFIISTHSPFLLSMKNAKIYDMDARPVTVRPWTQLKNVRVFYDFFREHTPDFE